MKSEATARPAPRGADDARGAPRAAPAGCRPPQGGPRKGPDQRRQGARPKGDDAGRRAGKLTLTADLEGEGGRQRSLAAMRRKQERARAKAMGSGDREKVVRDVQLPEAITVGELANRMAERVAMSSRC